MISENNIFNGFEAYKTPTEPEYSAMLKDGLVSVDANVLLNVYRYTDQATNDLLEVFAKLGENLWVSHQAVKEFWRNREAVLRDRKDTTKTTKELEAERNKAIQAVKSWANRVSLPPGDLEKMTGILEKAFQSVATEINRHGDGQSEQVRSNTNDDMILARLAETLKGRVGTPLEKAEYDEAVQEGLRRIELQIPPGYKDKSKDQGDRAVGDYLMWRQLLIEAKSRNRDVLFVTNDIKEDWWRIEPGDLRRGPRPELCNEIREFANVGLFILRPGSLLEHAQRALSVDVQEQSVDDINRMDDLLSQEPSTEYGGWTLPGLTIVLGRLNIEAPVQAAAIAQAVLDGTGYVSRADIYRIGKYSPDRKLIGFTRPINRITDEMREYGFVDDTAVPLVDTDYGADSPGFGWASGFRINTTVLPLLLTLPPSTLENLGPAADGHD